MRKSVGMRKIVPKVIIRIAVLVFLIIGVISIVAITIKDLMEDVGDSGMYHTSLEYSYYSGEYGRLFNLLPDYDKRYTESVQFIPRWHWFIVRMKNMFSGTILWQYAKRMMKTWNTTKIQDAIP